MPEKKCFNCENMDFCAMYQGMNDIASLFSANLDKDIAGDWPLVYMTNHMARNCKRFSVFKDNVCQQPKTRAKASKTANNRP